jgi:hypothetical protein
MAVVGMSAQGDGVGLRIVAKQSNNCKGRNNFHFLL